METVRRLIRDVPDFPKQGILFRDITPVLEDPVAFREVIEQFANRYRGLGINKVAGIESRGFIFGSALAYALGAGFAIVRKPGKLPRPTYKATYDLEYGQDELQIHRDAVLPGDRVVVLDDLIATGGTAKAAAELVQRCGGEIHELGFVIELSALRGRELLGSLPVHALLTY